MTETADTAQVPTFPDFQPLRAGHRDIVNEAAAEAQPRASEMSFAYLFGWRDYIQPHIACYGDSLLVLMHSSRDEASYLLPPLGDVEREKILRDALEEACRRGIARSAARLPEELAKGFRARDGYHCRAERGRADYVYRQTDLRDLPLPDYRDKRNRVNRFWSSYSGIEYRAVDGDRADRCAAFCREWRENHPKGDSPGLVREVEAVCTMLEGIEWLGMQGGVLKKDGSIIAFSLGEQLNEDTFAVRAEKADTSYRGSYQAINQEFVRNVAEGYRLINRESDMGVPGIRKAKESYNPCHLVRKWRVEVQ